MRPIQLSQDHQPCPRRETPQWVTVAEDPCWGDRLDSARRATAGQTPDPYGVVRVECLRSPSTDLDTTRFLLQVCGDDEARTCTVECSSADLSRIALAMLDAAQHGIPLELKRAGYDHAVAPWFAGGREACPTPHGIEGV